MANLLFLAHRLPYPPNKGDKVRSYHLFKHLAARHRVFLGCFVDDPDDWQHLETVRSLCADAHFVRLDPRRARIASLVGIGTGEALSLRYYRDAGLAAWVRRTAGAQALDAAIVFSSTAAPYAEGLGLPVLIDFVDVDSAKWAEYAGRHAWPLSRLYRREGERLLAYERAACARSNRAFFSTEKECALFRELAPECAARVECMDNGVDAEYFRPDPARASPYAAGEGPVVFTGAMDYWPNVDAVTWFAADMLPALRRRWPALRLHIVGRNPAPAVQKLAGDAVHVTGTVPDVRPWLQHAAVVVAPLRLARGIQNKVLEAMAMGRPVVAAAGCADALRAEVGADLLAAQRPDDYVQAVDGLLHQPDRAAAIGRCARARVQRDYAWDAKLAVVDRCLDRAIALRAHSPEAAAVAA
jgi:sugar transferase (PEP-CTERM/EpsH1 system associated)